LCYSQWKCGSFDPTKAGSTCTLGSLHQEKSIEPFQEA
jgi:hypothetical protein